MDQTVKSLTPQDLEMLMREKSPLVLDVRDTGSFEVDHITSATHLALADARSLALKADKDTPIVVYCYHGVSSQSVAQHFVELGFTDVSSLTGGFEAWKAYHACDESKS
ncbi:MAG: hypothetical protein A3J38_07600 [Gammaproteobacteria bacterium RIFCSPHIGHO2_12_FULL_45_9]|nr:MAG: hypothetical protein A3J38_07600 [Gammaproteobacteria bacterium RIFCSPHIGHO2_12_FULL_45_9]